MTVSSVYFLVSFFTQGSALGRETGHACNALNLGCGTTIKSMRLTDTAKGEDILKLYEIEKQSVLYHLVPNVMHRHLNTG
jgi:hypothetical protein